MRAIITRLIFTFFILSFCYGTLFSQLTEQMFFKNYSTFGQQEMFYKSSLIKGFDGFLYSCGATLNQNGNYDLLLSKLTTNNIVVWSVTYAGVANGDDFASDLVQDSQGNIVVTGAEYISAGNYNALTIKYSNTGNLIWLKSFNGAANSYDGGVSIVVDQSNNYYISGASFGQNSQSDFLAIKYNVNGTQLWSSTWNSVGLNDLGARIAINNTQVAVVGASQQSSIGWKMAAVYFEPLTGALLGSRLSGGNTDGLNRVSDVAIDANDNTYLIGAVKNLNHGLDLRVIKLSSNYDVIWEQTQNGSANLDDEGMGLELTASNDVVICGYINSSSTNKDIIVSKYNGTNGSLLWSQVYDEESGEDKGIDLKLDLNSNVIVCASSFKTGNLDFLIMKYAGANGALVATSRWNGDSNLNDVPINLAVDPSDNSVYVVGQTEIQAGKFKYVNTHWFTHNVYLPSQLHTESGTNGFIQNRGQLRNDDLSGNASVKFYTLKNNIGTYVSADRISYQSNTFIGDSLISSLFRVDMNFDKGNNSSEVFPLEVKQEYFNYYLAHMASKAERTHVYKGVVKFDIYPDIDMIFSNSGNIFKNYIIAKPAADLSQVTFNYLGQDQLYLDNLGMLNVGMGTNSFIQMKPVA
jgi:hypothetical protein